MRPGLLALLAALLLAVVVGQNTLLSSTEAETTTSAPGTVLAYTIYAGGCFAEDLHVLRYVPTDSPDGQPVVATWCA